ncbi:hypothetical protein GPECTOR_36g66 [Gonium pectorale]|uniref:Uncharacterized protein n=1 Tax=Gonium pectorale TaxID=33097 RepID=A0A150GBY2_GONPE|nr:hypothetical protein GPECTOR_36g66 [Gonium pectorale]|eukprot:KXZ47342.1 hypothetical protein GPECTOR_36g66 [Gonium pectorale]
MGILAGALALACVYLSWHVAVRSIFTIVRSFTVASQAVLSLHRALRLVSLPPGASLYVGPPTWWDLAWRLITLGSLRGLFGPGTFLRSYALLVLPAGAVAVVAGASMVARSELARELLRALRGRGRVLLGIAVCGASACLAEDAAVRCLLCGRAFPAALRGSGAVWLGFGGVVALAGPEEHDGLSHEQILAWARVLALLCAVATAGTGSGTLLLHGRAAAASAARAAGAQAEVVERVAYWGYGCLLGLAAATAASSLMGSSLLWRAARGAARLLDAALRVRPLLRGLAAAWRWLLGRPAVRATAAAGRRLDDAMTGALLEAGRRTMSVALWLHRTATQGMWPLMRDTGQVVQRRVVAPALAGARAAAKAAHAGGVALQRRLLQPAWRALLAAGRAGRTAAVALYRHAVLPLLSAALSLACWLAAAGAALLGPPLRGVVAPVLWPAGAVAGTAWFCRQAAAQRALLPFGAAAYASALIVGLMAGKAMRKSRRASLARAGARLEAAAAHAYLHLDFGTGTLLLRLAVVLLGVGTFVSAVLMRTGRVVVALIAGPLFGLLAAALTAASWVAVRVARLVGPRLAAAAAALRAAVRAVWGNPELSLAAALAAVGLAYAAHVVGLPTAAARGAAWLVATTATCTVRLLLLVGRPCARPLLALALHAARLLGVSASTSARAAAGASSALAAWGARAAGDVSSLFASRGFSGAFVALNLAHALLLRGWAVAELKRQGAAGQAAVLPVISFVARSTAKVALTPMYVTAAAAFLLGGNAGGDVAASLASLTAPALWLAYLAAMYLEAETPPQRRSGTVCGVIAL